MNSGSRTRQTLSQEHAQHLAMYSLAQFDVAAELRLDGLNMYYFSQVRDAKANGTAYRLIVPENRHVDIRGWFVTRNDSDEFVVVPREKSVIAQANAGNPAGVGTITANFHRAWDHRRNPRPADEPPNIEERFHVITADYAVGVLRVPLAYAIGTESFEFPLMEAGCTMPPAVSRGPDPSAIATCRRRLVAPDGGGL